MSSNVDDVLHGYLPEGAEAMNSVLQQFLVDEEHGTFRFCGEELRQDEDWVFMSQPKTTLNKYNLSLATRNMT